MQLCEMCDVHVPVRVSVLCYCLKFSFWPKGLLNTKLSLFHKTDDKRFFTKMNPSTLFIFFLSLRSRSQVSGGFQQTWKCSQRLPIFSLMGTFELKLLSRAPQRLYLASRSMRMCRWDVAPWTWLPSFLFWQCNRKHCF